MSNEFFPFRLYSNEQGHSPSEFYKVFNKNKPEYIEFVEGKGKSYEYTRRERFSFYCYDVIILSQTEIEFVCFDMNDYFYGGGKGKEIHRFRVTTDKSVTNEYVVRRLFARGVDRREQELAEAERNICQRYANDEAFELGISFKD